MFFLKAMLFKKEWKRNIYIYIYIYPNQKKLTLEKD